MLLRDKDFIQRLGTDNLNIAQQPATYQLPSTTHSYEVSLLEQPDFSEDRKAAGRYIGPRDVSSS